MNGAAVVGGDQILFALQVYHVCRSMYVSLLAAVFI